MSKNVLSAPVASYMKASGLGDALNLELTSLLADLDVNARWTSDDTPLIYLPDEDDIYSLASVLVSLFFGRHGKCLSDWLWGDTSAVYNLALLEMNWLCGAGATAGTCPFEIGAFTGVRACGLKERRKMRVACFYGLLLRLSD
ncbi:MAG: hypothetical protein LBD54_03495, partial [Puniceicoccales bacterium]|nr:hypothetical protein [Puniceicoccales bacterium]